MVQCDGMTKGMKIVQEPGVDFRKMKKKDIIARLAAFEDFKNEKIKIQRLLLRFEINTIFLPKLHPELKPIERV